MNRKCPKGTLTVWSGPDLQPPRTSQSCRQKVVHTLFVISLGCAALLPTNTAAQIESLVASNTAFALNLYAQLATNSGNIFFSPYSISTCMAMTYAGARGNTEAQMSRVFGFDTNQQQFASSFGQLQTQIESEQQTNSIELNIANALWTQVGFPFLADFLDTATNQYQANINQADFTTEAAAVAQAINEWVAQQTQNKIQNLVPPSAITAATRLILANAIYFKGAWTYTFADTNTSIQPFYLSSTNQVEVPLMYQPRTGRDMIGPNFNYMQTPDFQALELPYGSNQLSMMILLPTRIDALNQLEQQLSPSFLSNVFALLAPVYIDIFLPRFTNESSFNLSSTLSQMGMPDAFSGAADFSGMDGMHDLSLSFVYHKGRCEVAEAGTVAAAATASGVATSGGTPQPPPFRADHPFVFLIRDTQTGSLLFIGRLMNPTKSPSTPVPIPQLSLTWSNNMLNVSWPYPSTPWTLQQSSDLSGTNWTRITARGTILSGWPFGNIPNDGTNNMLPVFAGPAGNLFFRLIRQ